MPEVGELGLIKKNISLGGLAEIRGVSALRKKDDDEGEIQLEIKAGFRNISDTHIERAQLTTKLIDQRDAEIESNVDYNPVPSKSAYLFQPSFWGIKSGKAKNAEIKFSGSIFVPLDTFTAEAEATLNDADWLVIASPGVFKYRWNYNVECDFVNLSNHQIPRNILLRDVGKYLPELKESNEVFKSLKIISSMQNSHNYSDIDWIIRIYKRLIAIASSLEERDKILDSMIELQETNERFTQRDLKKLEELIKK